MKLFPLTPNSTKRGHKKLVPHGKKKKGVVNFLLERKNTYLGRCTSKYLDQRSKSTIIILIHIEIKRGFHGKWKGDVTWDWRPEKDERSGKGSQPELRTWPEGLIDPRGKQRKVKKKRRGGKETKRGRRKGRGRVRRFNSPPKKTYPAPKKRRGQKLQRGNTTVGKKALVTLGGERVEKGAWRKEATRRGRSREKERGILH